MLYQIFISLVVDREKPIERPEPEPEISEEERKRRIEKMRNVRKELGFDDEVVIEEEDTEPKEPLIKVAEALSLELMPFADGLAESMDKRPHERIEDVKALVDMDWDTYTPGVILRAIDIALFESGHKKPVNPNRKD